MPSGMGVDCMQKVCMNLCVWPVLVHYCSAASQHSPSLARSGLPVSGAHNQPRARYFRLGVPILYTSQSACIHVPMSTLWVQHHLGQIVMTLSRQILRQACTPLACQRRVRRPENQTQPFMRGHREGETA